MAGKISKRNKRLSALTASVLALAVVLTQSVYAFDAEENEKEQESLQKQIEQYESTLEETKNDISEKEAYAKALQGKIEALSKQIKLSNEKISSLNESIKEKQSEIDEKLEEIEDELNQLRSRLRAIYMAGDTSSLEIILGAKDFSDFIDKAELVQSISDYDSELISELQSEMSAISDEQEALKKEKSSVEKEKKSLESQKEEINKLSEENSKLIAELQGVESATLDSIGETEESQAELEKELQEYYEEQKAAAEKKSSSSSKSSNNSSKSNSSGSSSGSSGSSSSSSDSKGSSSSSSSEYIWPCPGFYYLSSTYDESRGESNHGALDIAGSGIYGAEVVAAREGTVVSAYSGCTHDYGKSESCGCGGGYGNYVIIEHSDGKTSLYGHLSAVYVSYGDYVSQGQLIGLVGSTGYSSGPHLHFETKYSTLWDHSQRYNPLDEYPGLF